MVGNFFVKTGNLHEARVVGVSTKDRRRLNAQELQHFEEQARADARAAFGALRPSNHQEISDLDGDTKVEVRIMIHPGPDPNDGSSALVAQELAAELTRLGFDAKAGSSGTGRVWATVPAKTALELARRDEIVHMDASPADEPLRDAQSRRRRSRSGFSYVDVGVSLHGFGAKVQEDAPQACAWIIESRRAQVMLFRGKGTFSDLPALRKLDYDKNLVVMVMGRAGSHDSSITIPELTAENGHLAITIERHPPPRNRFTNWTTSRPFRVIAIPRTALKQFSIPANPVIEITNAEEENLWEGVARVPASTESVSRCLADTAITSHRVAASAIARLVNEAGLQGGGPSGLLEEKAVDREHSVVLLYDNQDIGAEHGRDTHIVAVIDRENRRPVLTLAELPPIAGYDTCRTIGATTTGWVVISTSRCDYGGESKVKLSFDLKTRAVTSEKFGQDVPIDPTMQ